MIIGKWNILRELDSRSQSDPPLYINLLLHSLFVRYSLSISVLHYLISLTISISLSLPFYVPLYSAPFLSLPSLYVHLPLSLFTFVEYLTCYLAVCCRSEMSHDARGSQEGCFSILKSKVLSCLVCVGEINAINEK